MKTRSARTGSAATAREDRHRGGPASPGHIEHVHLREAHPKYNMPYTPAIKVARGSLVFVAGVTAAPVYHSHPHVAAEFAGIPEDAARQTEMALANLRRVLQAAGGDLGDIVQVFRFIKDLDRNQDAINATMARHLGAHRPPSTTVEVLRMATDPRLVVELSVVAAIPGRRALYRRAAGRPRRPAGRRTNYRQK